MKYHNILFWVDYPHVDVNAVQHYHELLDSGHLILSNDLSFYDAARDLFGSFVAIDKLQYDMKAIQQRFGMQSIPTHHEYRDNRVIFHSASEHMQLSEAKAASFITHQTTQHPVVFHRKIGHWEDQGDIKTFLTGSFACEQNLSFEEGHNYLLSKEQLSVISQMVHCPEFMQYYDENSPSLFIHVARK